MATAPFSSDYHTDRKDIEDLIARIRSMLPYRSDIKAIFKKLVDEEGKDPGMVFLALTAARILNKYALEEEE